jgi:hypothetical protein
MSCFESYGFIAVTHLHTEFIALLPAHKSFEIIDEDVFVETDRNCKTTFNTGHLVESTISIFLVERS